SGMGGISVLRSLLRQMPGEYYIFWGDNQNAPYGTRSAQDITALTWGVVHKLLARDIKALVIACNTATAAAASDLRAKLAIPVLGLEPALKPAAAHAKGGAVVVLATEATLRLEKYARLLRAYGQNTHSVACPELVAFVERGDTSSDALMECLKQKLAPYAPDGISAIVLGCTHFVWLKDAVKKILPDATVFDGNDALARHLEGILGARGLLRPPGSGGYELHTTSDDPEMRALMHRFLAGI
ncbi:MAG: glutamate racemase, partial [Christensenellales bacterium]